MKTTGWVLTTIWTTAEATTGEEEDKEGDTEDTRTGMGTINTGKRLLRGEWGSMGCKAKKPKNCK